MPTEKDFETALAKYPELIEEGLQLTDRQMVIYGRRMDLVFSDRFHRTLITELKWGPIKDVHIGQIMAYEGILLSSTDPSIRVMLIGTRVPQNLRISLDHHGIAWKEITQADLISFLGSKCDLDLLRVFEEATVSPLGFPQKRSFANSIRAEATAKMGHLPDDAAGRSGDSSRSSSGSARIRMSRPNEPLAELIAVVNAYDLVTPEPDMRVRPGKAKNYRQIVPLGWKRSHLHYEFYQACGVIGAELHIHSPNVSIAEFLKTFHKTPVANGERELTWDGTWKSGNGRLHVVFPLDSSPETVAAGMRNLISMTKSGVSDRIGLRQDFPR